MNKTLLIRVATGVVASLGIWVAYTQTPQPRPPLTIEKIKDDLFVIVGNGGNVAAYVTDEGVILIDDKFEQDNAEILAKLKSVTDKPIRYVLNTHQHGDHTGGNAKMLAASAEILIQKNARANMVAGKMPGIPRISYSDETEVNLGGKEVRRALFRPRAHQWRCGRVLSGLACFAYGRSVHRRESERYRAGDDFSAHRLLGERELGRMDEDARRDSEFGLGFRHRDSRARAGVKASGSDEIPAEFRCDAESRD